QKSTAVCAIFSSIRRVEQRGNCPQRRSCAAFTPLTITAHVRPALIAAFASLRSRCGLSFGAQLSGARAKRRREASPEETHKRKRIMEDDLYGDLDAGVASAEVARLRADLSRAEASA
ncbi:unnamed protein product, partial [Pelagomonas calceolata]